jgi:hypothetical protein
MPYKDPERQRTAKRESARRCQERKKAREAPDSPVLGLPAPPSRDELLRLLGVQARQGHVVAIRTLLDEYRRDHDQNKAEDAFAEFDELAAKRAA